MIIDTVITAIVIVQQMGHERQKQGQKVRRVEYVLPVQVPGDTQGVPH